MAHAHGSRVQEYVGDPVSEAPVVDRDTLEEIFKDIGRLEKTKIQVKIIPQIVVKKEGVCREGTRC